tara:strand:+ start:80 stop:436 length:357 start_codon:yes stop_codon:yes gene_type:complete
MKKLFYLASGIILCASFLPKEVNANTGIYKSKLFPAKQAKELKFDLKPIRKCKNKRIYTLNRGVNPRDPRIAVIGKKFGRFSYSSGEANIFFQNICKSPKPGKMMKKGIFKLSSRDFW